MSPAGPRKKVGLLVDLMFASYTHRSLLNNLPFINCNSNFCFSDLEFIVLEESKHFSLQGIITPLVHGRHRQLFPGELEPEPGRQTPPTRNV